jgi:cell division protease FtsH
MVKEFGMSDKIGQIYLNEQNEEIFLGRDISRGPRYSSKISELIDEEISNIIDVAKNIALKIISENIIVLNKIVSYLLERETLSGEDIDVIVNGDELEPLFKNNLNNNVNKEKA